jgi:Flp pilus assembly protein TadD
VRSAFARWIKRKVAFGLLRIGRLEAGARILDALVAADLGDTKSRRLLAWALNRTGRHEEAQLHYRDLADLQAHDAEMHAGLGESFLNLGRTAEGLNALRVAAEIDPTDPWIHYAIASGHEARGELQDALVAYRRLLMLNAKDADAANNFAVTLGRLEHWEDSATTPIRHSRSFPGRSPRCWVRQTAASRRSRCSALIPRFVEAHTALGWALLMAGRPEEARRSFDRAPVLGG